jgi:hypothetical protein
VGRYSLVWYAARITASRENPGRTHVLDEFYYGLDAPRTPRLLCSRAVNDKYWSAAKCRREGIDLPDEPSLTDWPTCDGCSGAWAHILTSQRHTLEARPFRWEHYWEETHGLRPVGQTAALLKARNDALQGKPMFPQLRSSTAGQDTDRPVTRRTQVTDVALEAHLTETFTVEARGSATARRTEAELVLRYAEYIACLGSTAVGKQIDIAGAVRLRVDLFDLCREELVEAKSSNSRNDVRLALGQLLDYQRYVLPRSMAVLLPADPEPDIIELLHSYQITCIVEDIPGSFKRIEPPGSAAITD